MCDTQLIELLIQEANDLLASYRQSYSGLSWRDKVLLLAGLSRRVKSLGIHTSASSAKLGARERIRLYLVAHAGTVIDAIEVEVVSGISEYGRRIRELRVEDGYKILTSYSNDPEGDLSLKPGQYLLIDPTPDHSAARRWKIANRIRREQGGGSQSRILNFLLENVGEVVTTEELEYVAKATEFGRRVRELRTEQGYPIATKFTGRPDLRMGEYVLESPDRVAEPHDRNIPFALQKQVYERDKNACHLCRWDHDRWSRNDPRILELHHVHEHSRGGLNTIDNLVVLCSRCHDAVHAGRAKLPP